MRKNFHSYRPSSQTSHDAPYRQPQSSWQPVSLQYTEAVGKKGSYYHQHVVLPNTLRLLNLHPDSTLLDLACGQGVLERAIPKTVDYLGTDASSSLIRSAQQMARNKHHEFMVSDVTRDLPTQKRDFTHAAIILALQNIEQPELALHQAASHLAPNGILVAVLNHPCFRIPRQSSWGVDETKKTQYRRIDRYASPLKIPVTAEPSRGSHSAVTWSYHFSLGDYSAFLYKAGFAIALMEEWGSDKVSVGPVAKMENRSRSEFPLFLAIKAMKVTEKSIVETSSKKTASSDQHVPSHPSGVHQPSPNLLHAIHVDRSKMAQNR